ncbi:hypothetical protein C8Q80DRAFT_1273061 [Daedaleopsis nitida]|nr:hypothetical protein C8Q80DRAFT_1273061 [Daedaleopsis nitida]
MSTNMTQVPSGPQLATMQLSLRITLCAFFLESVLCGAFVVMFTAGIWAIISKRLLHGRSRRDVVLFAASIIMFALTMAHLMIDAHVLVASGIMLGEDLRSLTQTISNFFSIKLWGRYKLAIYVLQAGVADSFMIYRVFVIWNSSWRIILLPLSLLVSALVLGLGTAAMAPYSVNPRDIQICVRVYFILNVVTNVIATVLVMKPLVVSRTGLHEYRPKGSPLRTVRWRVMESILQSAAIFTVSALVFTITQFVSPLGSAFCHYFFPPVVGMTFILTAARICLSPPDHPRRSMHEYNITGYSHALNGLSRSRSHSCPSLPTMGHDTDVDVDRESCHSHAATITGLSGRPIAIQVSVSTTQRTDRDTDTDVEVGSTASLDSCAG